MPGASLSTTPYSLLLLLLLIMVRSKVTEKDKREKRSLWAVVPVVVPAAGPQPPTEEPSFLPLPRAEAEPGTMEPDKELPKEEEVVTVTVMPPAALAKWTRKSCQLWSG